MARSFPSTMAALLLLLAAAAPAARAAVPKTVKVVWTPPGNTADEMDRPKLLNCGDTLRLVCAPGEKHGVYKIANVTGACPKNFASPLYGETLLPPTLNCDFKISLKSGDNYFLAAPGECGSGMKMLVKVFCDDAAVTTSKLKLGSGIKRLANGAAPAAGGAGNGSTAVHVKTPQVAAAAAPAPVKSGAVGSARGAAAAAVAGAVAAAVAALAL